jgi:predicted ATPase
VIQRLQLRNFKSWREADIEFGSITIFFGANSSGKTALLQFLLLLKQTVEHPDPTIPLFWGDERSPVDLGGYLDAIYRHDAERKLEWRLSWQLEDAIELLNATDNQLSHRASVAYANDTAVVEHVAYTFAEVGVWLQRAEDAYEVVCKGYALKRTRGQPARISSPIKCYGFPEQAINRYQNADFLARLGLEFTRLFERVYYLGPLREHPKRQYRWAGAKPRDVGFKGELTTDALIASQQMGKTVRRKGRRASQTVQEAVAEQLQRMGLVSQFRLREIAPKSRIYEVQLRRTPDCPEVAFTDIGFGVSQVLPVITLCYYVPERSIVILEQPEIHLHPAVQMALADAIINAVKTRSIQVIIESHSEHFLLRLQRRIAEGVLTPKDARLYFCELQGDESRLTPLQVDRGGNILNYPPDFFGDPLQETLERRKAALK